MPSQHWKLHMELWIPKVSCLKYKISLVLFFYIRPQLTDVSQETDLRKLSCREPRRCWARRTGCIYYTWTKELNFKKVKSKERTKGLGTQNICASKMNVNSERKFWDRFAYYWGIWKGALYVVERQPIAHSRQFSSLYSNFQNMLIYLEGITTKRGRDRDRFFIRWANSPNDHNI